MTDLNLIRLLIDKFPPLQSISPACHEQWWDMFKRLYVAGVRAEMSYCEHTLKSLLATQLTTPTPENRHE